jgi:hypothetical protein
VAEVDDVEEEEEETIDKLPCESCRRKTIKVKAEQIAATDRT